MPCTRTAILLRFMTAGDALLARTQALGCRLMQSQEMKMVEVSVDVGIGECVKMVDSIIARRAARKENYISNLCDDLEAASQIVKTLDNLFIRLVRGFSNPKIMDNSTTRDAHLEETMKYLSSRELLPRLQTLIEQIEVAAAHKGISKNRELVETLDALVDELKRYRERLGFGAITSVGQREKWNLMTLWEKAQGQGDPSHRKVSLTQMAQQVHHNQDFRLSDAIHMHMGRASGHAKAQLA
jgi:hypothetical protein